MREDGRDGYFQIDHPMDSLTVAKQLRGYLRGEAGMDRPSFAECCERHLQITVREFDRLTGVHMEHPEKATGAFELDFDKQEFSTAHPAEGWRTYPMKDISTAAYHAFHPDSMDWSKRTRRFTEKLAGRRIRSTMCAWPHGRPRFPTMWTGRIGGVSSRSACRTSWWNRKLPTWFRPAAQ